MNKLYTPREDWLLDPDVAFFNHGSFGATPKKILELQRQYQEELEKEPVQFMLWRFPELLQRSTVALAKFIHANPEDLVLLSNATEGVNTVLRAIELKPGDEILAFDQIYGACKNAAEFVSLQSGAVFKTIEVSTPVEEEELVQNSLSAVSDKTKLFILDAISSPTGIVFPIERIVKELEARGVMVLVDAAHALGQIEIDIESLGASFYVSNAHKWLCAPKGTAFLHVSKKHQQWVNPLAISHGYSRSVSYCSRFQLQFGWTGTRDCSAWFTLPMLLNIFDDIGGWKAVQKSNVLRATHLRKQIEQIFKVPPLAPDEMFSHMGSILVPQHIKALPEYQVPEGETLDPLWLELYKRYGIEIVVSRFKNKRIMRFSMHVHVRKSDEERLLKACLSLKERD